MSQLNYVVSCPPSIDRRVIQRIASTHNVDSTIVGPSVVLLDCEPSEDLLAEIADFIQGVESGDAPLTSYEDVVSSARAKAIIEVVNLLSVVLDKSPGGTLHEVINALEGSESDVRLDASAVEIADVMVDGLSDKNPTLGRVIDPTEDRNRDPETRLADIPRCPLLSLQDYTYNVDVDGVLDGIKAGANSGVDRYDYLGKVGQERDMLRQSLAEIALRYNNLRDWVVATTATLSPVSKEEDEDPISWSTQDPARHERYILAGWTGALGNWGGGETIEEATANFIKSGKFKSRSAKAKALRHANAWRFDSDLPFAPGNREATEEEADSYVDATGAVVWIRCERVEIETSVLS